MLLEKSEDSLSIVEIKINKLFDNVGYSISFEMDSKWLSQVIGNFYLVPPGNKKKGYLSSPHLPKS